MALSQIYTAVAGHVITAARWNNEFGNIYTNGTDIAFPLTKAVSYAGFTVTYDVAGVSTIVSSASQAFNLTVGSKSGTPGTNGQFFNLTAGTFTDTGTVASGTAALFTSATLRIPTLAASNVLVTTTAAATLYIEGPPAAGTNETITNAYALFVDAGITRLDGNIDANGDLDVAGNVTGTFTVTGTAASSGQILGNFVCGKLIGGLTYANSAGDVTNDITIAAGEAASDDATASSRRLLVLASAITKQLDATWAVGTNAGGLDTGSIANTDYFIWLILRSDTGVVDVLFSTSATAPTMPTNYTFKRLIGWIRRSAGAINIFTTYETVGGGLEYKWTTAIRDVNIATLTTSRRLDVLSVPVGLQTTALVRVSIDKTAATTLAIIQCPDETDAAPSPTVAPLANLKTSVASVPMLSELWIKTDTSAQVASRSNDINVDAYKIVTYGFIWSRR